MTIIGKGGLKLVFCLSILLSVILLLPFDAKTESKSSFLERIKRSYSCQGSAYCLAIWVSYELPEEPDLAAGARTLESKCLNARIVTQQACSDSSECMRNAEASFRRCISGIAGVKFWIAADAPAASNSVTKIYELRDSDEVVDYTRRKAPRGSIDQRFQAIPRADRYVWTGHVYVFKRSVSGKPLIVDERSCTVITDLGEDDMDDESYRMRYGGTTGCAGDVCAFTMAPDGWNTWSYICNELYWKIP
jgi:hypothetical protein